MRDRFTNAYTMNITKTAELAIDERLPPDRAIKARVRTRLKITATEGVLSGNAQGQSYSGEHAL
jgi:hypothetical protein